MRKFQIDSFAKYESSSLHVLGIVLFFVSLLMIPPMLVGIHFGDNLVIYIMPMIIGLVISVPLVLFFKNPSVMRPVDGLLMVIECWLALFVFGIIPYLVYGMGFVDSVFESVSGFTTAGATIVADLGSMPNGLLVWRAMTQWVGGIIVVMFFMFIIPMVVSGGRSLLQNEMSGSGAGNLYLKMGKAAKQYIIVYLILTVVYFAILMLLGLSAMESSTIALCVISTGGFMITNDSFSGYDAVIKIAVIFFMLLSATNFYLTYRMVTKRDFKAVARNNEFNVMCVWFIGLSILICIIMAISGIWTADSPWESVVDVFFSVISIGTTTGFTTLDYTSEWPFIGLTVLLMVMFVGGSAGSTAGGVKINRAIILVKSMLNELRQTIHPSAVYGVRVDNKGVDDSLVHSATVIIMMFFLTMFFGAMVFDTIMNMDEALFASVALVSGTGPGMGSLFGDYTSLPNWAKLFACVLMFLGRLEIVSVLVFLTPGFWKELIGSKGIKEFRKNVASVRDRIRNRGEEDAEADGEELPEDGPEVIPPEADPQR